MQVIPSHVFYIYISLIRYFLSSPKLIAFVFIFSITFISTARHRFLEAVTLAESYTGQGESYQ